MLFCNISYIFPLHINSSEPISHLSSQTSLTSVLGLSFSRWSVCRLRPGQTDTSRSLGSLRVCRRSAGHRRSALPGLEVWTGLLRAGLAVRREREVFCQGAAVRVCRQRSRCPNRFSGRTEQRNRALRCFLLSRYAVKCHSHVLLQLLLCCGDFIDPEMQWGFDHVVNHDVSVMQNIYSDIFLTTTVLHF